MSTHQEESRVDAVVPDRGDTGGVATHASDAPHRQRRDAARDRDRDREARARLGRWKGTLPVFVLLLVLLVATVAAREIWRAASPNTAALTQGLTR
jgi:hypothetical protein